MLIFFSSVKAWTAVEQGATLPGFIESMPAPQALDGKTAPRLGQKIDAPASA